MKRQLHRTCVRMSVREYELLKKKSTAAGLSANAWLMAQLETNRPVLHREKETWEVIHFMDEAGREINAIARDFNSGYGRCVRADLCVEKEGILPCGLTGKLAKPEGPRGTTAGTFPSA